MRESRLCRLEQWEVQILRVRPLLRALTLALGDLTKLVVTIGALVLAVDHILTLL
jgi:hypothetical protein